MQCFTLHLVLLSTLLSTATCNTGKKNRNLFGVYVYDDLGTGSIPTGGTTRTKEDAIPSSTRRAEISSSTF